MSTYSNRLHPALQNLLQGVVRFLNLRSPCTTTYISADIQRITLSASFVTISGEKRNNSIYSATSLALRVIFCFIDVKLIPFFHGALQLWNCEKITRKASDLAEYIWFFHPRLSCTTHLVLFSERRPIYASSCMTISGGRIEQHIVIGFGDLVTVD